MANDCKRFKVTKANGELVAAAAPGSFLVRAGADAVLVDSVIVGGGWECVLNAGNGVKVNVHVRRLPDAELARVGLMVYFDVEVGNLGAGVVGGAGATADTVAGLSADNAGDLAFVSGAVARDVFALLDAAGNQGGIVGGAKLVHSSSCMVSVRKL
jgi:hypothetical protein